MNKIIPIIAITVAVLALAASVIALIMMCVATNVASLAVLAAPIAIVGMVVSAACFAINMLFKKSKLCLAAAITDVVALALSISSVIVWQCAV